MKAQIEHMVREEIEIEIEDWMAQAEAARFLGISHDAVRFAMNAGRLPTVWLGKARGTLKNDVEQYKAKRLNRLAAKNQTLSENQFETNG